MRLRLLVASSIFLSVLPTAASAEVTTFLHPPVDAAIAASFDSPLHPYGTGHRGVDFAVPPGSSVRAAEDGTVSFAGPVGEVMAVTIDHNYGVETTYSRLSEIFVRRGDAVTTGTWIGRTSNAHGEEVPGLHFGVKVHGRYVDPLGLLGPVDTAGAIALAPLETDPVEDRHVRTCKESGVAAIGAPPPNDNIVVLVGGIRSSTDGSGAPPDLYASAPRLGYSPARTYRFSYRGTAGPGFHEPYGKGDTYNDIRVAADRLGDLLREIARAHPGVDVDLLAHSQGGIVARTYLTQQASAWDPELPRIEHLVTFASPHRGVPAAGEVDELRKGAPGPRLLTAGLDLLADRSDVVPPTAKGSVPQLRTDSDLLAALDHEDVMFGTRVLTLGIANDVLVPAGRTGIPGKPGLVMPAQGVWGHSEIVESKRALQVAHAFLAGAGVACPPELGVIERHVPSVVDRGHSLIGEVLNITSELLPFP